MGFKDIPSKTILLISLAVIFLIGFVVMKFSSKTDLPSLENNQTENSFQNKANPTPEPQMVSQPIPVTNYEEDAAIQQQLDRVRQQQKQTKDLKIKLEQINLELDQEKALAEINKLKKENIGPFDEPAVEGQKNLPEIKVDYIGGDSHKKEAILSIGSTSYQVKEKSIPTENIQVVSISDSSVTLHFSEPQNLTKTIVYKPD